MFKLRCVLVLCAFTLSACASKHSHSGTSGEYGGSARAETPARLFEGMGTYHRPVSTQNTEAQRYFDQGMVWMFAFNHDEAIRSFKHAAALDPSLAIAWWGVALCNGPHYNRPGMNEHQNTEAWGALQRAVTLSPRASEEEQELIRALAARYAEKPPADRRPLDEAYARVTAELWRDHAEDADVGLLHAEALMNLRPWDLWTIDGQPKEGTNEIVSILEQSLALAPDHPGLNHLYIHAMEACAMPSKADGAAGRLRYLVPASGHLVHMPSHIDVRTGRWALAAESNERAIDVDARYRRLSPRQDFYNVYMLHNPHFLSYVSMMEGRSAAAMDAARMAVASPPRDYVKRNAALMDPYLFIEYEALLRFGKWDEVLRLPAPPEMLPITRAMWRFSRGVALAALGRTDDAQRELERLRQAKRDLPEDAMMAINKAHHVLDIADRVLSAEIAYRRGETDSAISLLRGAIELEDKLVYMEPPEWMMPVRHTLGAILLEAGRAEEAEAAYREDLRRWPENGWSLHGLAKCLRARGSASEAEQVEARFEKAWSRADVKIETSCMCVKPGRPLSHAGH